MGVESGKGKNLKLKLQKLLFTNYGGNTQTPPNVINIHSALMNLGSNIFMLPYSIKFDCVNQSYFVVQKSNKVIGITVLLHLLYIVYSVVPLYRYGKTPVLNGSDVVLEGSISRSIKSVVVYLVVAKQFVSLHAIWNSRNSAAQIHNKLARVSRLLSKLCQNPTNRQIKAVAWFLAMLFLFRNFWEVLMTITRDGGIEMAAISGYPNIIVSRFYAWYSQNSTQPDSYTAFELMGGVAVTIMSLYSTIFENYVDFWTLEAAVLLNLIMECLTVKLKTGTIKCEQENEVFELLHQICRFVELTNNTISWIFAANVSITLPYQAAYIMDVFYSEMSTLFALNLIVNMVFYVGIIVIAVNANSRTREISCWFQSRSVDPANCYKDQPMPRRISIILSRLDADAIAFRGGPFFTLTYNFLGNAISFIITYCVIIMQNQVPN